MRKKALVKLIEIETDGRPRERPAALEVEVEVEGVEEEPMYLMTFVVLYA